MTTLSMTQPRSSLCGLLLALVLFSFGPSTVSAKCIAVDLSAPSSTSTGPAPLSDREDNDPSCLYKFSIVTDLPTSTCQCTNMPYKNKDTFGLNALLEKRNNPTDVPTTTPFPVKFRTASETAATVSEVELCCAPVHGVIGKFKLVCGCPSPLTKVANFVKDYNSAIGRFDWLVEAKKSEPFDLLLSVVYSLTSHEWMNERLSPIFKHLRGMEDLDTIDKIEKSKFVLNTARYFLDTDLQAREVLSEFIDTALKIVPTLASLAPVAGPAAGIGCNLLVAAVSMSDLVGKRDFVYTLAVIDGLMAALEQFASANEQYKSAGSTGSAPTNFFAKAVKTELFDSTTSKLEVNKALGHLRLVHRFMLDKTLLSHHFLLVQALNYIFKLRDQPFTLNYISPYAALGPQLLEAMKVDLTKIAWKYEVDDQKEKRSKGFAHQFRAIRDHDVREQHDAGAGLTRNQALHKQKLH